MKVFTPKRVNSNYMEASEPKRDNLVLNIIGVNSLRLGGLHIKHGVNSLRLGGLQITIIHILR